MTPLDHACVIADTPAAEVQVRRYMGRVLALVGWTVSLSHLDVAAEILETTDGRRFNVGTVPGWDTDDAEEHVSDGLYDHLRGVQ